MKALCCSSHTTKTIRDENPILDEYRDALEECVKDPKCENPGFETRDLHDLLNRAKKYLMRRV
jgi:chitinase